MKKRHFYIVTSENMSYTYPHFISVTYYEEIGQGIDIATVLGE